jgi:hypothetical protein
MRDKSEIYGSKPAILHIYIYFRMKGSMSRKGQGGNYTYGNGGNNDV